METIRRLARQIEIRQAIIREVNVEKRFLQAEDSYGTKLLVKWNQHAPVVVVPKQGEVWNLKRQGVDWALDSRVEATQLYTDLTGLIPGDKRLEAIETLRLEGKNIALKGSTIITGDLSVSGNGPLKQKSGFIAASETGILSINDVGFMPKVIRFLLAPSSSSLSLSASGYADINGTQFWTGTRVSSGGQFSANNTTICLGWLSEDDNTTISNQGNLMSMDENGFTLDITSEVFAIFFYEAQG